MVSNAGRGMQNRRGLINGGPDRNRKMDEKDVSRSIDRMTYIAFAAMGVVLGALTALYLIGGR